MEEKVRQILHREILEIRYEFLRLVALHEIRQLKKAFMIEAIKAGFNPSQLLVPAGNPDGGQWTDGGFSRSTPAATEPEPQVIPERYKPPASSGRTYHEEPTPKPAPLPKRATVPGPRGEQVDRVNIFIGGLGDETIGHAVEHSPSLEEVYGDNYYISFADEDYGNDAISDFIETLPKTRKINLIGHSYGGDTAAKVAQKYPGRIDMLVTIDPVSEKRPDFVEVRNNVRKWVNVNAGLSGSTIENFWAGIGKSWDTLPKDYTHIFINAPFNHEQFTKMMRDAISDENGLSAQEMLNQDAILLRNNGHAI